MKIGSKGFNVSTIDTQNGTMSVKEFEQAHKLAELSGVTKFVGATFSGTSLATAEENKITYVGDVDGTITKSGDSIVVNLSS